jgi:thioredoxin 2
VSGTSRIVCPSCNTTNNVPTQRLGDGPLCGKCKQALFPGAPVELDQVSFSRQLANSDVPLLVDCWAPWCGPCRAMAPAFEQAATALEPAVRLAKLNTEDEQAVAAQLGIRSIPTLILFHKGREIARQSGSIPAAEIVRWTRSQLASPA